MAPQVEAATPNRCCCYLLLDAGGARGCLLSPSGRCLLRRGSSTPSSRGPEQNCRGLAPIVRALQWSSSRLLPGGNDTVLNDPPLVDDLLLHFHIKGNCQCHQTAQSQSDANGTRRTCRNSSTNGGRGIATCGSRVQIKRTRICEPCWIRLLCASCIETLSILSEFQSSVSTEKTARVFHIVVGCRFRESHKRTLSFGKMPSQLCCCPEAEAQHANSTACPNQCLFRWDILLFSSAVWDTNDVKEHVKGVVPSVHTWTSSSLKQVEERPTEGGKDAEGERGPQEVH